MAKILYLVTQDWYFCSHRLELAQVAKSKGHEVIVVTSVQHHANHIIESGLKLVPVNFSRSLNQPWSDIRLLFKLYTIYKNEKPDIIHHVALKPVLFGSMVHKAIRIVGGAKSQVVNALTGLGYIFSSNDFKAKLIRFIVKPLLKSFLNNPYSYVILQNKDDFTLFTNNSLIDKSKVSLIRGSGVDISLFSPLGDSSFDITVILAARMLIDKGVGEFVDAARLLRKKKKSIKMVLVGDLDYSNPSAISKEQLQKWQDEGVIEWWGKQLDMSYVFSKAHIVCLPSYREGLPKVLLEAAASAKPLVASDVPGCREIVIDGFNGFLVPARNANSLANAIDELVTKPENRKRMGENGRQLVEQNFSNEIIIGQTIELYNQVLRNM